MDMSAVAEAPEVEGEKGVDDESNAPYHVLETVTTEIMKKM